MRLHSLRLGIAVGIVWAFGVLLLGGAAIAFDWGAPAVQLSDDDGDDTGARVSDAGVVWTNGSVGLLLWKWGWDLDNDSPRLLAYVGSDAHISSTHAAYVVHGLTTSDVVLFELAPEPKAFETIAGAGHNDTVEVGRSPYFARIARFLDAVAPL